MSDQRVEAVDVHAHYVAPGLIEALATDGPRHGLGVREETEGRRRAVLGEVAAGLPFLPGFSDAAGRLAWMNRAGIARQLVSGWMDLAGYHLRPEAGQWLARTQNETLADLVWAHPDRFVGSAMVPLQAPELAVVELRHAVERLGFRAVQIGTNVDGRGLDEPELVPFWAAAQELEVPIVIHPAELGGPERTRRYFMHILVGNPSETTFAAAALLLGGVLERFPGLRFVLVHGGGFLPYQLGRLVRGFNVAPPAFKARATRPPDAFLSSLYFDTILHDARALRFLLDVVGPSQVVLGSDCPFPIQDPDPCASLGEAGGLTREEREAVVRGNAASLLRL